MEPSILSKFLPRTEKEADYFLALAIGEGKIKAAACKIKNRPPAGPVPERFTAGEVEILGEGIGEYNEIWEEAVLAADKAISQVEEKLPEKIFLNKVVLGLLPEYIKEEKIEESYLVKIKELCQKLSLTPLGFVEIPLAIIHFLEKQKGEGPESLILVRVGKKLDISLVRVGKLTNYLSVPVGENLATDLEKALNSLTGVEILPSKILLYDGQPDPGGANLEKARQELINHPWPSRANFLHFPKIEIIPFDFDIKALAYAGASEMAKNVEIEISREPSEKSGEEGETLGFVKGKDILEETGQSQQAVPPPPQFVVSEEPSPGGLPKKIFSFPLRLLMKIKAPKIPDLSRIKEIFGEGKRGFIGGLVFLLLVLVGGWFMLLNNYPTATVNLLLEPKILQQEIQLSLNPKITAANGETKEIPALTLEVENKETKKMATTGKKLVGDPAKGELIIYNLTNNSKVFKKGTILISPNNLKFTLDDEITVASSSTGSDYVKIPGKQNARLTAEKIGPEGNLGVGQEFHFADYPTDSYVAKNNTAFSGGTSREISVVTRADQEKLLASASTELTEQAKKDLSGKVGPKEIILEKTISSTLTSKKFDKEVDEEATEISLDLAMKFTALGVKEDDLLDIFEKTTSNAVPSGFELRRSEVKSEIVSFEKKKDETLVLKVDFSASLLPKTNNEEIQKNLAGKNLSQADKYLKGLGNLAGYEIKFGKSLPFIKDTLPLRSQNISIETSSRK